MADQVFGSSGSMTDTQRNVDRVDLNDSMLTGVPDTTKEVLLLCPLEAGGSKTDGDLVEGVTGPDQARDYFGNVAAIAIEKMFAINPTLDLDCIAVDATAGTAATWTITFDGDATADDTCTLSIGGYEIDFEVSSGDTDDEQATALAAAITADANSPFTAGAVDNAVTITCLVTGELGNSYKSEVRHNDSLPADPTVAAGVTGATDPDVTGYVDTFKGRGYRTIANPWSKYLETADDRNAMKAALTYMSHYERAQGALMIHAMKGTYSAATTRVANLNDRWDMMLGWVKTAEYWMNPEIDFVCVEAAYQAAQSNPAIPFHGDVRQYLSKSQTEGTAPAMAELENGIRAGLAPYEATEDGQCRIHVCVSTCTKLDSGVGSFAKASVHIFYTDIAVRRALLATLAENRSTPAQKQMVDGKAADIQGAVVDKLYELATPSYNWLSKAKLDQLVPQMQIGRNLANLSRLAGGAVVPTLRDYRGTDLTMWLVNA